MPEQGRRDRPRGHWLALIAAAVVGPIFRLLLRSYRFHAVLGGEHCQTSPSSYVI